MYSYIKNDEKGGKTAKGIRKNVIKNYIKHEDYKNVLLNNKQLHHKMKTIRSQRNQLGSYEINKISLSCFDDKHYIHNNGIPSYAYGHYKIEYINDTNLSFYPISVSILWRRYDFLSFYQISVSILWRKYDFLSFYSKYWSPYCGEDVTNPFRIL